MSAEAESMRADSMMAESTEVGDAVVGGDVTESEAVGVANGKRNRKVNAGENAP